MLYISNIKRYKHNKICEKGYWRLSEMRSQEFMTLGSMLVVLGIIFGNEDWLIGYSFIGAEVLLSIVSAFKLRKKLRMQSQRTGGT
jgi:hypothetical protein